MNNKIRVAVLGGLALSALTGSAAVAETIWREAETANTSTFKRHPWWYDKVKADQLSGEAWLSHYDRKNEGLATFQLNLTSGGTYTLWIRANPSRAAMSYRFGENEWKKVDFNKTIEKKNIAVDGKEDIRYIAWVKAGQAKLDAGEVKLQFKTHSPLYNHGAIDIFVLTNESFDPKTAEKPEMDAFGREINRERSVAPIRQEPEEPTTISDAATWAFTAPESRDGEALLDLRFLNEKTAGAGGWIGRGENGEDFVNEQGQPVRFWAVNSDMLGADDQAMAAQAAFLASKGVNLVRILPSIHPKGPDKKMTDVDEQELANVHRFVAACKAQGIYVSICPFWADGNHLRNAARHWGIEGYDTDQVALFGLMFFHEPLQNAYKSWVRELYTRKNPHTGLALKDDPAVALAQVMNEDSLLFFTFQAIREPLRGELRKKWAKWLTAEYGSPAKATEAWGEAEHFNDRPDEGQMGLYQTWKFTQGPGADNPTGEARRMADQMAFLIDLQRSFYADMKAFYTDQLGCKQLILAGNSPTAKPLLMDDAERYTCTAADVIGVNRFVEGYHMGPGRDRVVQANQQFADLSVLREPQALPVGLKQVAGHPMVVTESTWLHPNRYQSEGAMLAAAYMSLNGVDALCWSTVSSPGWLYNPVDDQGAIDKRSASVPQIVGMFPANAVAFRRGYIARADKPVLHEARSLEALRNRKVPVLSDGAEADETRGADAYGADARIRRDVDRLALLAGPAKVAFGKDAAPTSLGDLDSLIDRDAGTVTSSTGQIRLDWNKGICTVQAPKYQAVAGFIRDSGGVVKLSHLGIDSINDYLSVAAVSLDDKPLAQSGKVLIQVGTVARPSQWATLASNVLIEGRTTEVKTIVNAGENPWKVIETKTSLTLKNGNITRATVLNHTGRAAGEVAVRPATDGIKIALPAGAMYVLLQ